MISSSSRRFCEAPCQHLCMFGAGSEAAGQNEQSAGSAGHADERERSPEKELGRAGPIVESTHARSIRGAAAHRTVALPFLVEGVHEYPRRVDAHFPVAQEERRHADEMEKSRQAEVVLGDRRGVSM